MRERNRLAARLLCTGCAAVLVAACQPDDPGGAGTPGQAADAAIPDPESTEPYAGIDASETVRLVGTEPFWGGQVAGTRLTYTTPDNPDGTTIAVERAAERQPAPPREALDGAALELAVTALACSDGMSDRAYPFTVTLRLGEDVRGGCGWSERQPFTGPARP